MMTISAEEIRVLTQYIYAISGVSLDASKAYLLETRLRHLLQKYACRSYLDLHSKAQADRSGGLEKEIVDAITTNETLFFRDSAPFELFKHKILPELIDARSRAFSGRPVPLRIWSAACSTGQEVYSIAIALREALGNLAGYQISILGTDISDEAVAKASYGKYNRFEIERGLPPAVLHKYFTAMGDGWKIRDEIRAMAVFKKFNLMKPFTGVGRFDVVFCRNVAIYFTAADKRAVFEKIAGVLEPDGALLIGSTESLSGVTPAFEPRRYMRSIFYQPTTARSAALPGISAQPPTRSRPPVSQQGTAPAPRRPTPAPVTTGVSPRPPSGAPGAAPAALQSVGGQTVSTPAAIRPPAAPIREARYGETSPSPTPMTKSAVGPEPGTSIENQAPTVHPAQFVRPAQPLPPRPTARGALSGSHAGDKSALKRLLLQKKQRTAS